MRLGIMIVGLLFVIGGAFMLYFEAGWDEFIPIGVMTAGLVLLIGLVVVSFASYMRVTPPPNEIREERPVERTVEVRRERPVERTVEVRRDRPAEERTVVRH